MLMLPGKIRAHVEWFEADASRVFCAHDIEHFDSAMGVHFCMTGLSNER